MDAEPADDGAFGAVGAVLLTFRMCDEKMLFNATFGGGRGFDMQTGGTCVAMFLPWKAFFL